MTRIRYGRTSSSPLSRVDYGCTGSRDVLCPSSYVWPIAHDEVAASRRLVGVTKEGDVGNQSKVVGHRAGSPPCVLTPHRFGDPSMTLERGPRTVLLRQRLYPCFPYETGDLADDDGSRQSSRGIRVATTPGTPE